VPGRGNGGAIEQVTGPPELFQVPSQLNIFALPLEEGCHLSYFVAIYVSFSPLLVSLSTTHDSKPRIVFLVNINLHFIGIAELILVDITFLRRRSP
jgi:hypothetical protein